MLCGRQGISTKSATLQASRAMMSAWGGVSITTRSAPSSAACWSLRGKREGEAQSTTSRSDDPRHSLQWLAVACGSVSRINVVSPAPTPAAARWIAKVVLPAPPFWLMTVMTFMRIPEHVDV